MLVEYYYLYTIWTTNYYTSIYDIFLATSGLTGTQDWLFVMKNNQCCVGAPLLWIMDPISIRVVAVVVVLQPFFASKLK